MSAGTDGARWSEFERSAPHLASAARQLFNRYEVVLLATNGMGGYPRMSLVEPALIDGDLVIGTQASDVKSKDLRRDGRCSIHSLVRHRTHDEGEFKAQLQASEIPTDRARGLFEQLARPEFDWVPTVAFMLTVERAAMMGEDGTIRWRIEQIKGTAA